MKRRSCVNIEEQEEEDAFHLLGFLRSLRYGSQYKILPTCLIGFRQLFRAEKILAFYPLGIIFGLKLTVYLRRICSSTCAEFVFLPFPASCLLKGKTKRKSQAQEDIIRYLFSFDAQEPKKFHEYLSSWWKYD